MSCEKVSHFFKITAKDEVVMVPFDVETYTRHKIYKGDNNIDTLIISEYKSISDTEYSEKLIFGKFSELEQVVIAPFDVYGYQFDRIEISLNRESPGPPLNPEDECPWETNSLKYREQRPKLLISVFGRLPFSREHVEVLIANMEKEVGISDNKHLNDVVLKIHSTFKKAFDEIHSILKAIHPPSSNYNFKLDFSKVNRQIIALANNRIPVDLAMVEVTDELIIQFFDGARNRVGRDDVYFQEYVVSNLPSDKYLLQRLIRSINTIFNLDLDYNYYKEHISIPVHYELDYSISARVPERRILMEDVPYLRKKILMCMAHYYEKSHHIISLLR